MTRRRTQSPSNRLPREYVRALTMLETHLDRLPLSNKDDMDKRIWVENSVYKVDGPYSTRSLPSEDRWRWNQSKSRKSAILSNNTNVDFYKLCTRKRDPGDSEFQSPGYKLWKFEVNKPNSEPIVVLWCEKGIATEGKPNTPYTNKIQEFTLRSSN